MEHPPPPRRHRCCCGRLGWAITIVAVLSMILVGFSAAAYQRMLELEVETNSAVQRDHTHDNIVVVMNGHTVNLGDETHYTFEEQVQVLSLLMDHPDRGLENWYLESSVQEKIQQEEPQQEKAPSSEGETLPQRRQLSSSPLLSKLPALPSNIGGGNPKLPPLPSIIKPIIPTGFPTGVEDSDQPPLPTNGTHRGRPLLPTGRPIPGGPSTAYPKPTKTPAPPLSEQPGQDLPNLPRDETAQGDTRPPIGKVPRPTKGLGGPAPPSNPPGFKLPSFIQLPTKLIYVLKRVVGRLATNAALPNEMRDVLRLVLHLLDRISKSPALPGPTSTSKILPTLTRPPIGKKPTLPPLPTTKPGLPPLPPIRPPPGRGKLPHLPPPGKGKFPHLPPPGKGKFPRPPGTDQDQDQGEWDTDELEGEPLSGFVEVTRRGAAQQGDTTVWPTATPTGPVELLGKRPLTKPQRQYMLGEAAVLMHEEIEREREKNPNDPLNDLINVPMGMAVFSRLAKHAEKWMGKQDPAERRAIEESVVEVGDDEDWDYGEGEWF